MEFNDFVKLQRNQPNSLVSVWHTILWFSTLGRYNVPKSWSQLWKIITNSCYHSWWTCFLSFFHGGFISLNIAVCKIKWPKHTRTRCPERGQFTKKNAWVWHLFFWEAHTPRYSKEAKWKYSMCGLVRNFDFSVLGYVIKR